MMKCAETGSTTLLVRALCSFPYHCNICNSSYFTATWLHGIYIQQAQREARGRWPPAVCALRERSKCVGSLIKAQRGKLAVKACPLSVSKLPRLESLVTSFNTTRSRAHTRTRASEKRPNALPFGVVGSPGPHR